MTESRAFGRLDVEDDEVPWRSRQGGLDPAQALDHRRPRQERYDDADGPGLAGSGVARGGARDVVYFRDRLGSGPVSVGRLAGCR